MLQQTQVTRVLTRWHEFIGRWPTPDACASASLADVLRMWQGLGYPRRARNLHAAARQVVELGNFPSDLAGLLRLPGVGPYTARAVLAFAFEADAAVVDTNVARVYARLNGAPLTATEVQRAADNSLPVGRSWLWNQVLMDLGALVCRPTPACEACPLRQRCRYRGIGVDPAVGSAGVSGRQPRFDGSDRQARGRLMRALSAAPVATERVATVMAVADERADRLLGDLTAESLVTNVAGWVRLPE
jgi:A/G-specific adenine glycosylase